MNIQRKTVALLADSFYGEYHTVLRNAIEVLLQLMLGAQVSPVFTINPHLIKRRSCGCCDQTTDNCSAQANIETVSLRDAMETDDQKTAVERALLEKVHVPKNSYSGWAKKL